MWYFFEIFIVFFLLILFWYFFHDQKGLPINWPLLGMLPALLKNTHNIHSFIITQLEISHLAFHFKGPWFTNMDMLVTVDPANVHHVMSKNFVNYPKGSKFRERLDVLGDSISTTDFEVWQYHRKMAQSFLSNTKFNQFLVKKTWDKVENGLIPVLDHVSKHCIELDLQDLFARFTFDTICTMIMDHDPKSLSVDLPNVPSSHALEDISEVFFYRHVVPTFVWKFQRWLDVGIEHTYRKAWKTLDTFIYKCIALKREEMIISNEESTDLLTLYIQEDEQNNNNNNNNKKASVGNQIIQRDKFLRDMILSKFIAGRDTITATLSWFFYLLSSNPHVVSKIKKEVDNVMINRTNFKEVNSKLVYLHAALCETLRLYPPIAFEAKAPVEPDVLPSGHPVNPNMQIIFDLYAMGRMKSIWGEDCYEFKPERWISEQGEIRHEPSYKFFTFNSGPRTCLGKDTAFTQMKIVAATIIQHYVIEAVDEHRVVPGMSIVLHMKYGFKVRIRRSL